MLPDAIIGLQTAVRWLRRHPFLTWTLLGLLVAPLIQATGVQYDEGGWRGLLFWVGPVLLLPVWPFLELLNELPPGMREGAAIYVARGVAILGALIVAALLDRLLAWRRARKVSNSR